MKEERREGGGRESGREKRKTGGREGREGEREGKEEPFVSL